MAKGTKHITVLKPKLRKDGFVEHYWVNIDKNAKQTVRGAGKEYERVYKKATKGKKLDASEVLTLLGGALIRSQFVKLHKIKVFDKKVIERLLLTKEGLPNTLQSAADVFVIMDRGKAPVTHDENDSKREVKFEYDPKIDNLDDSIKDQLKEISSFLVHKFQKGGAIAQEDVDELASILVKGMFTSRQEAGMIQGKTPPPEVIITPPITSDKYKKLSKELDELRATSGGVRTKEVIAKEKELQKLARESDPTELSDADMERVNKSLQGRVAKSIADNTLIKTPIEEHKLKSLQSVLSKLENGERIKNKTKLDNKFIKKLKSMDKNKRKKLLDDLNAFLDEGKNIKDIDPSLIEGLTGQHITGDLLKREKEIYVETKPEVDLTVFGRKAFEAKKIRGGDPSASWKSIFGEQVDLDSFYFADEKDLKDKYRADLNSRKYIHHADTETRKENTFLIYRKYINEKVLPQLFGKKAETKEEFNNMLGELFGDKKNVWIVDDNVSTGGTMYALSRMLGEAGINVANGAILDMNVSKIPLGEDKVLQKTYEQLGTQVYKEYLKGNNFPKERLKPANK